MKNKASIFASVVVCALALQTTACVPAKADQDKNADDYLLKYLWHDSIDKKCAKTVMDAAMKKGASDQTQWGRKVVADARTHIERDCRVVVK